MILLDTMVLSELRKAKPNAGVLRYIKKQTADGIFLSALTIGEIEAGIDSISIPSLSLLSRLAVLQHCLRLDA